MSLEAMEIDDYLLNSMNDAVFEKFFDLKPIIPEITLSSELPFTSSSLSIDTSPVRNKNHEKQPSPANWDTCPSYHETNAVNSTPASKVISFGSLDQSDEFHNMNFSSNGVQMGYPKVLNFSENQHEMAADQKVPTVTRTGLQAWEHLISERKRRDKLSQLFTNLSQVLPGAKKFDKASLLEDAINYVKSLEEQVKALEEKDSKEGSITTSCKGGFISTYDHDTISSFRDVPGASNEEPFPEIKARILNKKVLIKICCKKQKGIMSRIPSELENLHLNVLDIRAMPFGSDALDITVLAQMDDGFSGTAKDIVEQLKLIFLVDATESSSRTDDFIIFDCGKLL